MSKVSVIIPCYNQGQYVDESVNSVLNQTYQDFEIIVVNDGSTDELTIKKLQRYQKPKTRVLHTTNQGLAAARNNGIKISEGEYILPLDADDKIGKDYLEEAHRILDANPNIGIVYCEAEYFGDKTGKWELPPYSFPEILLGNMIFCTALFRKSDWEMVGGYKTSLKYGCEDWEFWLSLVELQREVYRISKTLFYYRVKEDSMFQTLHTTEEYLLSSLDQIYRHHSKIYADNIAFILREHIKLCEISLEKDEQIRNLLNSTSYKIGRSITFPFRYFRKTLPH